jgi:hypothetical protein
MLPKVLGKSAILKMHPQEYDAYRLGIACAQVRHCGTTRID